MAFDSNNSNPPASGQTQPAQSPLDNGNQPKKAPISPWEENLPEEQPKEQKIGTLSNFAGNQSIAPKKEEGFVVPENIENQTALNVVEGSDYNSTTPNRDQNALPANDSPVDVDGSVRNGAMDLNLSSDKPTIDQSQTAQSGNGAPSNLQHSENVNFDDLDIFGDLDSTDQKNISQDIKPAGSNFAAPVAPVQSQSSIPNPTPVTAPDNQAVPADLRNIVSPSSTVSSSAAQTPPPVPVPPVQPVATNQGEVSSNAPSVPVKKSFFSRFTDRKDNNTLDFTQDSSDINSGLITQDQPMEAIAAKKRRMIPIFAVSGIVLFFIVGIFLTESGAASFGFEKAYNAMGLEVLWGGLPKNAEKSLGLSLFSMKDISGFKVNGDIKITVNGESTSEITAPLVSMSDSGKTFLTIKPEKAILAVDSDTTDTDTSGDWVETDTTTDTTLSDTTTTDTTIDDGTTASDQTSDTSATDQALDSSSYQTYQSSVKDVSATFDGSVSKDGSELNFSVDKAGTSEVTLKNSGDKLWVQSDKILFNSNAEDGKWLEYPISALSQSNLFEGFFASDFSSISVKGNKVGNEKIDKTRCFKYKIDSLELGEALTQIGISSDMVQSISGNIWVGIKDKMIRKIELNILPSSSSSVSAIEINMKLSSFDAPGSFTEPDSADTITDLASATSETATEQTSSDSATSTTSDTTSDVSTDSTTTTVVDMAGQNDTRRKSDLLSIKNALEAYKTDNGRYPISTVVAKLNVSSNILSQKLISGYITSLPVDPKDAEGWYYGYKSSDGKSYYLSARLETTTDPEIKTVDNIPLYFVYNE